MRCLCSCWFSTTNFAGHHGAVRAERCFYKLKTDGRPLYGSDLALRKTKCPVFSMNSESCRSFKMHTHSLFLHIQNAGRRIKSIQIILKGIYSKYMNQRMNYAFKMHVSKHSITWMFCLKS